MRKLPEEILFDSRLVDRHIRQGLTTRKDYQEWLLKQPDVSDRAEYFAVEGNGQVSEGRAPSDASPSEPRPS